MNSHQWLRFQISEHYDTGLESVLRFKSFLQLHFALILYGSSVRFGRLIARFRSQGIFVKNYFVIVKLYLSFYLAFKFVDC
jgi:hypothetical protein